MAGISLTFVVGHPLALMPAMQASAPIGPAQQSMVWATAQPPGQASQSLQPPGAVTQPVIS